MEQVLYAKYNSLRAPEYRITTEMVEKEDRIFVAKRAGEPAAEAHLARIERNEQLLDGYYRRIHLAASSREEDRLIFPLIQGTSLADSVLQGRMEKQDLIRRVEEALQLVLDIEERCCVPFSMTDEFRQLFGNVDPGKVPAMCPANLDSILDNFLRNDLGVWCIDYEWVCSFPVPVSYVKYRALRYLWNHLQERGPKVPMAEYFRWFGYSAEELTGCEEMESRFQSRVHGENGLYRYTERYRKETISLDELIRRGKDYQEISDAFFWKMTLPARKLVSAVRKR